MLRVWGRGDDGQAQLTAAGEKPTLCPAVEASDWPLGGTYVVVGVWGLLALKHASAALGSHAEGGLD